MTRAKAHPTPAPWPNPAALILLAAWTALVVLAPATSVHLWPLNGFRSVPLPTRVALVGVAGLVTALAATRTRPRWATLAACAVLMVALAFPLRERIHVLGDTDMRGRTISNVATGTTTAPLREWPQRFHASPLDLLVDLLLPGALGRLGIPVPVAISLVSLLLAALYLAAILRLVPMLGAPPGASTGVFAALVLTGALEAFAGYAEVAGLLLAVGAWWWWSLLRPLDAPRRAFEAAAAWLALVLTHRIGFVLLLPQLWRAFGPAFPGDRPEVRRRMILATLGAVVVALAVAWQTGDLYEVSVDAGWLTRGLLGARHTGVSPIDFAGALLLVAPLLVVAPMIAGAGTLQRWIREPRTWLPAVAALPLAPLAWLALAAENGLGAHRDWDLLVPLGLTVTLAGASLLARMEEGRLRRALPWFLPLLVLQAGAWVAVNANESSSMRSALALAGDPAALPTRQRGILHGYLGQRAMDVGNPGLAARYYQVAFDLIPEPEWGLLAAETWLIAGEPGAARTLLDQVRAQGPSPWQAQLIHELDSLMVVRARARAPVADSSAHSR